MMDFVDKVLQRLGLSLNRDKTRIANLRKAGASLDFLGFTFRLDRHRRGGGRYLNIVPSANAMNRVRHRLREMTQGGCNCCLPK